MQGSDRVRSVALGNDIPRASFALAALGGHAKFELNFVKAHSGTRVARDFAVRNSTAYTDDHGEGARTGWLLMVCSDYKYEFLAFAITMELVGSAIVRGSDVAVARLHLAPHAKQVVIVAG